MIISKTSRIGILTRNEIKPVEAIKTLKVLKKVERVENFEKKIPNI
jgi:hypothetical protein